MTFHLSKPLDTYQFMARKRFTAKKLARLEASTRFIQGSNRVLCILLAVAFGLLVASTAVPQKRECEKLQSKLKTMKAREANALAKTEHKQIELHALREDPEYLEVQARDRLNYYREGERILRFERN
ncbi:MAG: septum formation initiator family protein [Armatimonadetes bacterium]|nr:septum formation initiator family protein [Akkermansiaceae bacterium]